MTDGPAKRSVPVTSGDAPRRCAVVINPIRVDGVAERRRVIETILADAGWPAPGWFETTAQDPGAGQVRRAIAGGAEVVFVCGGDGTVRSSVEGIAGSDAALAVLPAGTGNLLALNFGLPKDTAEGVRMAVAGGRRRVDVGDVDGQVFAVMAGMGLDAAMLGDTSPRAKARFGAAAYVVSAVKHLLDRPMQVQLLVDEQTSRTHRARTVLVANVGRLQGGVRLLPEAEPDDGRLDIALVSPRHLREWATLGWAVLRHQNRVPHMEILRGKRITITTDRRQPRELDGDPITPSHNLTVTVRPGALILCAPHEASHPTSPTTHPEHHPHRSGLPPIQRGRCDNESVPVPRATPR